MNPSYADIREKLGEPKWWDEKAVPRYCDFHPDAVNVYANEVALVRIACQACGRQFDVAMVSDSMLVAFGRRTLRQQITDRAIHYGDPPNAGCCPAGPTMNCDDLRVLEFWERSTGGAWSRDHLVEITLPDGGGD